MPCDSNEARQVQAVAVDGGPLGPLTGFFSCTYETPKLLFRGGDNLAGGPIAMISLRSQDGLLPALILNRRSTFIPIATPSRNYHNISRNAKYSRRPVDNRPPILASC